MTEYNATDRQREDAVRALMSELKSHAEMAKGGFSHMDIRHVLITLTLTELSQLYCSDHLRDMVGEQVLETWAVFQKACGIDIEKLHPANRLGRFCNDMFGAAAIYDDMDGAMAMHSATRLFTSILMDIMEPGKRLSGADLMLKQIKEMVTMAEAQEKAMGSAMPEGMMN